MTAHAHMRSLPPRTRRGLCVALVGRTSLETARREVS
jgi:hypothetical protein